MGSRWDRVDSPVQLGSVTESRWDKDINSSLDRNVVEAPQEEEYKYADRSAVMEPVTSIIASGADIIEKAAAAYLGTTGGTEKVLKGESEDPLGWMANWIIQNKKEFEKDNPYIFSKVENEGEFRRWIREGIRSIPTSRAAGLLGGLAVTALGGGVPGFVAGFALGGGILFGLAEKDSFVREAIEHNKNNPDNQIPEEVYNDGAVQAAVVEGSLETLNNAIEAVTFGYGNIATAGFKGTVRSILKKGLKGNLASYAKAQLIEQPAELSTEAAQSYFNTIIRQSAGLETPATPEEEAISVLGPTFISTLLMGAGAQTMDARARGKIVKAISDPTTDFDTRYNAMHFIYKELQESDKVNGTDLAEKWGSVALYKLTQTDPDAAAISIDENLTNMPSLQEYMRMEQVGQTTEEAVEKFEERGRPIEKYADTVDIERPENDIKVRQTMGYETRDIIYNNLLNKGYDKDTAYKMAAFIMGAKDPDRLASTGSTSIELSNILDKGGKPIEKVVTTVPQETTEGSEGISKGLNIYNNLPEDLKKTVSLAKNGKTFSSIGTAKASLKKAGLSDTHAPLAIAPSEWVLAPKAMSQLTENITKVLTPKAQELTVASVPQAREPLKIDKENQIQPTDLTNKGVPFTNKISALRNANKKNNEFKLQKIEGQNYVPFQITPGKWVGRLEQQIAKAPTIPISKTTETVQKKRGIKTKSEIQAEAEKRKQEFLAAREKKKLAKEKERKEKAETLAKEREEKRAARNEKLAEQKAAREKAREDAKRIAESQETKVEEPEKPRSPVGPVKQVIERVKAKVVEQRLKNGEDVPDEQVKKFKTLAIRWSRNKDGGWQEHSPAYQVEKTLTQSERERRKEEKRLLKKAKEPIKKVKTVSTKVAMDLDAQIQRAQDELKNARDLYEEDKSHDNEALVESALNELRVLNNRREGATKQASVNWFGEKVQETIGRKDHPLVNHPLYQSLITSSDLINNYTDLQKDGRRTIRKMNPINFPRAFATMLNYAMHTGDGSVDITTVNKFMDQLRESLDKGQLDEYFETSDAVNLDAEKNDFKHQLEILQDFSDKATEHLLKVATTIANDKEVDATIRSNIPEGFTKVSWEEGRKRLIQDLLVSKGYNFARNIADDIAKSESKFRKFGITDFWQKYFVTTKQGTHEKPIDEQAKKLVKELYKNAESYALSEDSPAIDGIIAGEIQGMIDQGLDTRQLEAIKDSKDFRQRIIDQFAEGQKADIAMWVQYLKGQADYSNAFKLSILKEVLTSNYDFNANKIIKRNSKTIRGMTPLNQAALSKIHAEYKGEDSILKLYVTYLADELEKETSRAKVARKTENGKWLKFLSKTNDPVNFEDNHSQLAVLVQDTPWCTKYNSRTQLQGGDFYVYVTEDKGKNIPRLAVRMERERIGELRGIVDSHGEHQGVEPEMYPVAEEFLKQDIPGGENWLKALGINKSASKINTKIRNREPLTNDDFIAYFKLKETVDNVERNNYMDLNGYWSLNREIRKGLYAPQLLKFVKANRHMRGSQLELIDLMQNTFTNNINNKLQINEKLTKNEMDLLLHISGYDRHASYMYEIEKEIKRTDKNMMFNYIIGGNNKDFEYKESDLLNNKHDVKLANPFYQYKKTLSIKGEPIVLEDKKTGLVDFTYKYMMGMRKDQTRQIFIDDTVEKFKLKYIKQLTGEKAHEVYTTEEYEKLESYIETTELAKRTLQHDFRIKLKTFINESDLFINKLDPDSLYDIYLSKTGKKIFYYANNGKHNVPIKSLSIELKKLHEQVVYTIAEVNKAFIRLGETRRRIVDEKYKGLNESNSLPKRFNSVVGKRLRSNIELLDGLTTKDIDARVILAYINPVPKSEKEKAEQTTQVLENLEKYVEKLPDPFANVKGVEEVKNIVEEPNDNIIDELLDEDDEAIIQDIQEGIADEAITSDVFFDANYHQDVTGDPANFPWVAEVYLGEVPADYGNYRNFATEQEAREWANFRVLELENERFLENPDEHYVSQVYFNNERNIWVGKIIRVANGAEVDIEEFHTQAEANAWAEIILERFNDAPNFKREFNEIFKKRLQSVTSDQVQEVTNRISEKWKHAPQNIIVENRNELPDPIKEYIANNPAQTRIGGVTHHGIVYLITDELDGVNGIERAYIHETIGHYGIENILSTDQFIQLMNDVIKSFGTTKEFNDIAEVYKSRDNPILTAREYLAKMAEDGIGEPTFWDKVRNTINKALRAIGFNIQLTTSEIKQLISDSYKFVESGKRDDSVPTIGDYFEKLGEIPAQKFQRKQLSKPLYSQSQMKEDALYKGQPLFQRDKVDNLDISIDPLDKTKVAELQGGGTFVLYHGSNKIEPDFIRPVFFTVDKGSALGYTYANDGPSYVSKYKVTINNPADLNDIRLAVKETNSTVDDIKTNSIYEGTNDLDYIYVPKVLKYLKDKGFDGVIAPEHLYADINDLYPTDFSLIPFNKNQVTKLDKKQYGINGKEIEDALYKGQPMFQKGETEGDKLEKKFRSEVDKINIFYHASEVDPNIILDQGLKSDADGHVFLDHISAMGYGKHVYVIDASKIDKNKIFPDPWGNTEVQPEDTSPDIDSILANQDKKSGYYKFWFDEDHAFIHRGSIPKEAIIRVEGNWDGYETNDPPFSNEEYERINKLYKKQTKVTDQAVDLSKPSFTRITDFEDVTKDTPTPVAKDLFNDATYSILKTLATQLPKNQPGLNWKARYLLSPEWYDHPVINKIVKAAIVRHDRYYELFNTLNELKTPLDGHDTLIDANIALKHKGLSNTDILKGKVSKEYEELERVIDEGDTLVWKDQYKEGTAPSYVEHLQRQGISKEVLDIYQLHRQKYDEALDILLAPMRKLLKVIEDRAEKHNEKPKYPMFTTLDENGNVVKVNLRIVVDSMGQLRGTYAPRLRERGEYEIKGNRGDKYVRYHKPNYLEAELLKRQLERKGYKIEPVRERDKLPEDVYSTLRIINTQKFIESAMGEMDFASPEIQIKFSEELLKEVADLIRVRGFRASMVSRQKGKVTGGYITGPNERFVRYMNNIAAGVAKAEAAEKMFKILAGDFEGKGEDRKRITGIDPMKEPRAYDTATQYITEQLRNADTMDRVIGLVKSVATFKYLGFNPRSVVVNVIALGTTVPTAIHRALHDIDGKGKSFIVIGKEIAKASSDYLQVMRGKTLSDANEQKYMDEIKLKGYDTPQYTRDALGTIQRTSGKAWAKTMSAAMYMFGKSEQWIRGTTMLAAYRMIKAKATTLNETELSERAHDVSNVAHGIYGKATQLALGQGTHPFARLVQILYTYQKFSHNYLQMLYDTGMRKKNIAGFMYGLLSPIFFGGLMVWPFKDLFLKLASWIFKILGIGKDPEKVMWDSVRKNLGSTAERTGRHGAMGLLGMDISGSMSIGVGLPKDYYEAFGIAGGLYKDAELAKHFFDIGQPGRALEKVLPTAFANPVRALRETKGITTTTGNRVWDEKQKPYIPSGGEIALRVGGFRSAKEAVATERTWEIKRQAIEYKTEKDDIYEQYRDWIVSKGTEKEKQEIMKKINTFNKKVIKNKLGGQVSLITIESLKRQVSGTVAPNKQLQYGLQ